MGSGINPFPPLPWLPPSHSLEHDLLCTLPGAIWAKREGGIREGRPVRTSRLFGKRAAPVARR